jgi:hypothetical protein
MVTKFLFVDILTNKGLRSFFDEPTTYESDFPYQIAFGFMPRQYLPTPDDRYILEEEGDATEINFVTSGEWAIAFNTYLTLEEDTVSIYQTQEESVPPDMIK